MPQAIPVAVTGSGTPLTGAHKWYGFNFTENAGTPAAARVLVRDGGAAGTIIADLRLAASETIFDKWERSIQCSAGDLYVEVNSGTVRGAVYLGMA